MTKNEISISISGENGDGIFSAGATISKICSRAGLNVHGSRTYQSIIRTGHVSYSVRAANHETRALADYIDVLIALRKDSWTVDVELMMRPGGIIIYDSKGSRLKDVVIPEGMTGYDIPAASMAKTISSFKLLRNTVLIAATLALYGFEEENYVAIIREQFAGKSDEIIDQNVRAAKLGYEYAAQHLTPFEHSIEFTHEPKMYIGGNESLAFGMLHGGLQAYAFYPMTPSTPVSNFVAEYGPRTGCVVKQMEDEVNVANFVVGAGLAGARAACATSGGGFALMTEAVGLAGMFESPAVFIEVARGGPSTGLPTKTEQGDLNQLLGASQGDYPRAIIAQTGVEEGFYLGMEALNIADKYQMPVLISSDLYMGEHFETVNYDFEAGEIDRGKLVLDPIPADQQPFKRYALTEDGVSPRTIPGVLGGMFDYGSDEHDEFGYLVSDRRAGFPEAIEVRKQQMSKRMRKMDYLLKELPAPEVEGYSSGEAEILVVSWGSSYNTIKEVRLDLGTMGKKVAHLNIKYILPFHGKEVGEILRDYEAKGVKILMIEANYTGQMARHIRAETSFEIKDTYLKYDAEYLLPREVKDEIMRRLN